MIVVAIWRGRFCRVESDWSAIIDQSGREEVSCRPVKNSMRELDPSHWGNVTECLKISPSAAEE